MWKKTRIMRTGLPDQFIFLISARVPFPFLQEEFPFFSPRRAREDRGESIDMAVRIWVATFSLITCGFEDGCSMYR